MGGVEAAVLEGGGGLITNEGSGLDETEETAMVVSEETWTRFGLALLQYGRVTAGPKHGHVQSLTLLPRVYGASCCYQPLIATRLTAP